MKRTTTILLALLLAAPVLAGMGTSRGHDLDALWARAQKDHDLASLDALLLLESRHAEITAHGDLAVTVQRMVWIGTDAGLRAHADLRIPWNSDTSAFEVHALRTWRDGRWWPDAEKISPTAVVETLPYGADRCPDYAGQRETMLLHDGVELPCLMETAYTIAVRGGAARGADEVFVMAQREPALLVEYRLTAPKIRVWTESCHGAPEPVIEGNSRVWTMVDVPRLRLPVTGRAALYEPTLAWSTWPDREALAAVLIEPVEAAAVIGDALADTLDARLETVRSDIARARAVAALIDEGVRGVGYREGPGRRAPRTAARTWETTYAHDLDRAALALALLRKANLDVALVPWSTNGPFAEDVFCAADYDRLLIRIAGPGDAPLAVYDPGRGTLLPGTELHRTPEPPEIRISRVKLDLDLAQGDDGWSGRGHMTTEGALCFYGRMAGEDGEAAAHLETVLGTVLPGAALDGYTPVLFTPERVELSFAFTFDPGEPDARGRLRLELGDLPGGVLDELPGDVHVEDPSRESPVHLRTSMLQELSLRVDTGNGEVVRAPAARLAEDGGRTGQFYLSVDETGTGLEIRRSLSLSAAAPIVDWTVLRGLLLQETDPANRVILLEADTSDGG